MSDLCTIGIIVDMQEESQEWRAIVDSITKYNAMINEQDEKNEYALKGIVDQFIKILKMPQQEDVELKAVQKKIVNGLNRYKLLITDIVDLASPMVIMKLRREISNISSTRQLSGELDADLICYRTCLYLARSRSPEKINILVEELLINLKPNINPSDKEKARKLNCK